MGQFHPLRIVILGTRSNETYEFRVAITRTPAAHLLGHGGTTVLQHDLVRRIFGGAQAYRTRKEAEEMAAHKKEQVFREGTPVLIQVLIVMCATFPS